MIKKCECGKDFETAGYKVCCDSCYKKKGKKSYSGGGGKKPDSAKTITARLQMGEKYQEYVIDEKGNPYMIFAGKALQCADEHLAAGKMWHTWVEKDWEHNEATGILESPIRGTHRGTVPILPQLNAKDLAERRLTRISDNSPDGYNTPEEIAPVEVTETSALNRAYAVAGYGLGWGVGIASAEDMERALRHAAPAIDDNNTASREEALPEDIPAEPETGEVILSAQNIIEQIISAKNIQDLDDIDLYIAAHQQTYTAEEKNHLRIEWERAAEKLAPPSPSDKALRPRLDIWGMGVGDLDEVYRAILAREPNDCNRLLAQFVSRLGEMIAEQTPGKQSATENLSLITTFITDAGLDPQSLEILRPIYKEAQAKFRATPKRGRPPVNKGDLL